MDFELSREQKEIQKAVREFVKGEFKKDVIQDLLENHAYPEKMWKKAAELGFIGIHFPEEYSGQGLGVFENLLIAEEFCTRDSSVGAALLLASFANSLMWPAIWPLAMKDLGKFTKVGASLLVMAIVGGAVVPLIFGTIVDAVKTAEVAVVANYQTAYWVMVPCYLFILYFAASGHKIRTK